LTISVQAVRVSVMADIENPGERLRTWLDGRPYSWLAPRLGVTAAHVSQLVTGARQPSGRLAARIERLTKIRAADWYSQSAATAEEARL
jgi:plasmid maintenance system antidote protein VapI